METIARAPGAQSIRPFWERIPHCFAYPLHWRPLTYILFLAAVPVAVALTPIASRVVMVVTLVGVALALYRYAYSILERTAQGVLSPGAPYESRFGLYRPWKQLLILVVAGLPVAAVHWYFGETAAMVAQLPLLVLLPASVMWLAVTNSLLAAINPVTLAEVIRKIGWPYAALCGFLYLLSLAAEFAMHGVPLLAPFLPHAALLLPLMAASYMYFTLVAFHMMGYVLYQYHVPLGLWVKSADTGHQPTLAERVRDAERDEAALGKSLEALVAAGHDGEARDLLYELVRKDPENLDKRRRYHRMLAASGDRAALARHAVPYLKTLLRHGAVPDALALHAEVRALAPDFHMSEDADQLALAQAAHLADRDELALEMLETFERWFPDSLEQAGAYLLGARILHQKHGRADEARALLEHVVTHHPRDPAAREAAAMLERLGPASG